MKRLALTLLVATALASANAFSAPITLQPGPLYIVSDDAEQFSINNSITSPTSAGEGLWGILQILNIQMGSITTANQTVGPGTSFFVDGQNGGNQVLGIFYGGHTCPLAADCSTDTVTNDLTLDLYWHDKSSQNASALLSPGGCKTTGCGLGSIAANRTAQNQFTGFTNSTGNPGDSVTFLARLHTAIGIDGPVDPGQFADQIESSAGKAEGYFEVDNSVVGAWTSQLDSNWFTIDPNGFPFASFTRDMRLDSNFSPNTSWDNPSGGICPSSGGPMLCIVGLRTDDPMQAFAVPEPGTIALVVLALAGMGAWKRRR
jgi:hypothetical protein